MESADQEALFSDEEEEFEISNSGDGDPFDIVVGRLEEVVMSEEFIALKENFMNSYAHEFTADEENKLIYMEIFNEYLATIERYIEEHLSDLNMEEFHKMLQFRQDEIDGPLFEMLLSFTDFQAFKEMMLEANQPDLLAIIGGSSVIHHDEVVDGDERPDLDGLLGVSIK